MSEQQRSVRDWLRRPEVWNQVLNLSIATTIAAAQADACANAVVDAVWPHCDPSDIARISEADPDFLVRRSGALDIAALRPRLINEISGRLEPTASGIHPNNPYARASKFRKLVEGDIAFKWPEVERLLGKMDATHPAIPFATADAVKRRVLVLLNDRCLDECLTLTATREPEVRRRLKLLAALTTYPGDRAELSAVLHRIRSGATSEFPYVVKYLTRGSLPTASRFGASGPPSLDGFSAEFMSLYPEAAWVRAALTRYRAGDGILLRYIDANAPVSAPLARQFGTLDHHVAMTSGGPLVPKEYAIRRMRADRLSMPDGIVCAVGLATSIEWLLRQVQRALGVQASENARGGELLSRIAAPAQLSPSTVSLLNVIFDPSTLNVRDATAHGAFFADDRATLDVTIAGLTHALARLTEDLRNTGAYGIVTSSPRWDAASALGAQQVRMIAEQSALGVNLVDQLKDDAIRHHTFTALRALAPDKRRLGESSFYLWLNLIKVTDSGRTPDPDEEYTAVLAAVTAWEEFFRAVVEICGESTLLVTPAAGGQAAKCELAFLDVRAGLLLHPELLKRILGASYSPVLQDCFETARSVRDKVQHGEWQALRAVPLTSICHLFVKLTVTLAALVSVRPEAKTQS